MEPVRQGACYAKGHPLRTTDPTGGKKTRNTLLRSRSRQSFIYRHKTTFTDQEGFTVSRPRKPTKVLELNGAFKRNASRKREEFTPEEDIGPPPPHMVVEAEIWDEVVAMVPEGVLGSTDRIALEVICKLVFRMRYDWENMSAAQITRLETLLGRFGLTPSDRSKIVPRGGKKPGNPFEGM